MVTQSYGSYSPQAIDPYPIETDLAKASISSPVDAQSLLDLYQTQRATSEGNYNYAMQGQHEFAKQQLAQQLYEANLKALPELSKPGVAGILANAPQYQGVFGGASPEAIAQAVAQANQTTQATNLEHAGSGVLSLSSAGMPLTPGAVQGITGLPINPGVRPDIQIGAGHDAARLGAAAISASANAGPSQHYTGPPDPDIGGGQIGTTFPGKMHMTPEQVKQYAKEHGQTPQGITGLQPKSSAPAPGKSAPAPAGGGAAQRPAAAAAPGAKDVMDQVRAAVEARKATLPPAVYADIQAGMAANGGNPVIKQGPDGKAHIYGAKGGPY
jgi:hypothetical protein